MEESEYLVCDNKDIKPSSKTSFELFNVILLAIL